MWSCLSKASRMPSSTFGSAPPRRGSAAPRPSMCAWTTQMQLVLLNTYLPGIPKWQHIWVGSYAAFRSRFDCLQREVTLATPFLPSSLRPGGATFLFRLWQENLPRLQWRGRWRSFIRCLKPMFKNWGCQRH